MIIIKFDKILLYYRFYRILPHSLCVYYLFKIYFDFLRSEVYIVIDNFSNNFVKNILKII